MSAIDQVILTLEKTERFSVLQQRRRVVDDDPMVPLTEAEGDARLYQKLRGLFAGVAFEELVHDPTLTSEASVTARVAGGWTETTLASGAKAMLMRRSKPNGGQSPFVLCVLAADRKLDWKRLKKAVAKDLRLATPDEVFQASRCLPGAVRPCCCFPLSELTGPAVWQSILRVSTTPDLHGPVPRPPRLDQL